MSQYRESTVA